MGEGGSFTLQQYGTMTGGKFTLVAMIVPGSKTGELQSVSGTMEIDPASDHAYRLNYHLNS